MYKYIEVTINNILLYKILKINSNLYQVYNGLEKTLKNYNCKIDIIEALNFDIIDNEQQLKQAIIDL